MTWLGRSYPSGLDRCHRLVRKRGSLRFPTQFELIFLVDHPIAVGIVAIEGGGRAGILVF